MLARISRLIVVNLALVGLGAVVVAVWFASQGIGAKATPGRIETVVARRMRSAAIPGDARRRANPVPSSAEVLADGMTHFADHCAVCHANDGSGQTEMGQGLYPKAPDMRKDATQQLTDGELFYIIESGVRLTGMPGWGTGTPEGEAASWRLVHFIRHLPRLTEAEIDRMKAVNPRSAEEWQKEEEARRFLAGDDQPKPSPRHEHKH
jgi:mono/diheme cytochrome c family protein